MRQFSLLAFVAVLGCSSNGGIESSEEAASACTLVQSEIYNGANIISWAQGLEGCSGDVESTIEGENDGGTWVVWREDRKHYDDAVVSHYDEPLELPCVLRVHARFGDQERLTRPVRNYNCAPR